MAAGPFRREVRSDGGEDKTEFWLQDERMSFMKMNLKHCTWVLALAVGVGIGGGTQAMGAPFFQERDQQDHQQEHQQDYSRNKTYQQGMREGQTDHTRNRDHSKKRHFKKDEDQRSYEAGYQKGRGN
jgi:hypothetical protein